ncbi:hypothetical protein [Furfurilactobacillus milii]|uniref:hypothetical protein n=1 Tax=Furfurilactobacillus milii TaxID=2888272 RepID=UPI001F296D7A|nr:hypothetical protein [Furfurilactobacillus milii]MCF6419799.1 hypothetical protein [Furfurilactobacillus milii]
MNNENKWRAQFYGEGETWNQDFLTYEEAIEIQKNKPVGYEVLIVPMIEDGKGGYF